MRAFVWMITCFKRVLNFIGECLVRIGKVEEPSMVPVGCDSECTVRRVYSLDKLDIIAHRVDEVMYQRKLFLNPSLSLEMLAQEVGTNRTYLSRVINQRKGLSFFSYVNGLRLDYATSLLNNGIYDEQEIIVRSGFSSSRAFYKSLMEADAQRCYLLKKKYICHKLYNDMADEKIIFFYEWRWQNFAGQQQDNP